MRFTSETRIAAALGLSILFALSATAACAGSSPNRYAASAARDDVNDCVTAAVSGDTIYVPRGNSTWETSLTIAKNITLLAVGHARPLATIENHAGGAEGQTNITCTRECFILSYAHTIRIAGFNFTGLPLSTNGVNGVVQGKYWRVDHNSFYSPGFEALNLSSGVPTNPPRHATVLIDNNVFFNVRVVCMGTSVMLTGGNTQHQLRAQPPPFGLGSEVIYVEDNMFSVPAAYNWIDSNYAGRYVARFNRVNGGSFDMHSVQGNNRASQSFEAYKNTYTRTHSYFGMAFIRSGTGFAWGNRVPVGTPTFKLNNIRSNTSCTVDGTCSISGPCDGTSNWDQNTSGKNGYACRDQVGRGNDTSQWSPGMEYSQLLMPAYFWDNIAGTSTLYDPSLHSGGTSITYQSTHIVANRDYYQQVTSFNGTAGVGVGPIASRPSTCTAGVGYWATDQGEWNSRQPGPDGQLYRCISANTWQLYYTPHAYPHPLQNDEGQAPAPPTRVTATVR